VAVQIVSFFVDVMTGIPSIVAALFVLGLLDPGAGFGTPGSPARWRCSS